MTYENSQDIHNHEEKEIKFAVLGPPTLQEKLHILLRKNINIFKSHEVRDTHAILPPLDLHVAMRKSGIKTRIVYPPRVVVCRQTLLSLKCFSTGYV